MPDREPTRIGRVRHVLGAQVTVALDDDLAGVAPIYRGQLQQVGQIGSLVRIPQGLVDLIGQVSLVGIAELSGSAPPVDVVQTGERWLQVQLLGEVRQASGRLERGIGSYPGLDDPVHFATVADLEAVFPPAGSDHLQVGRLSASDQIGLSLKASRLITRHSAIVGSTGSGKTSAVSSLLQSFARQGWGAANIVVIDPHGEYSLALADEASVLSVMGEKPGDGLQVPFWALPALDILELFSGVSGGTGVRSRFEELVLQGRREFAEEAEWLVLAPEAVTADTPVPFDLRNVWHTLDWENRETRDVKTDPGTACSEDDGDSASLTPASFRPYGAGGSAPYKGPLHGAYGNVPELLRLGLADPRLSFFQEPAGGSAGPDPLVGAITSWLGRDKPVSVLDFSGVPARAGELAVGVVLGLLFEVAVRTPQGESGIGRPRPVLVVLEEAHRYLGTGAADQASVAANRLAREGRKYGVGLMLVTQRPSELPDTALSQCGTLISLRLTNSTDQARIGAALPDEVAGLAQILPSLRTGEAIISGEAVTLPSRVLLDPPDPWPQAEDASLASWRRDATVPDLVDALAGWREAYQ